MDETLLILVLLATIYTTCNGEPYNSTKIKVLEFTYPPGSRDMPFAQWQTQANLTKSNLPTSNNMCTSINVKSMVISAFSQLRIRQRTTSDGSIC